MSVLATYGLTKRYGPRTGLDALDLTVREGAIFGYLGPNGAGKTTTIRLLLGFLRPTGGRATVLRRDCWRESAAIKRDVGYLPGDLRLYPWMSCRNGLDIVGKVRGRDLAAPGLALAERFRLEPDVAVRKMSRGMRQKLGLVLALAHEPRLVVLDEPTAGLDPLMRTELAACLREFARRGHTVFFSSHTLSEVEELCDDVAIVREGRLVAHESVAALRERAHRTVTITFLDAAAARAAPPAFLEVRERDGLTWRAELEGAAPELVRWAAGQPIADLAIGPPSLDAIFRGYYRREAAP